MSASSRILVVDDSAATLEVIQRNLEAGGHLVLVARTVAEAVVVLAEADGVIDLVVTDVRMPGASGLDLVRHVGDNCKDTAVLVVTGYPDVQGAVEAIRHGAVDYLAKPFTDDELLGAVDRALQRLHARRAASPQQPVAASASRWGLLGASPPMDALRQAIERAARTPATVLVRGESGTGKELVARAIHYQGGRSAAPFVPVNCGAIPGELLESELFGHVKGAFTGATAARAGFFVVADGGTLFLDEIGDTSPAMQVKLLRVLQQKEVTMVGSSRARPVDVRIIAATHRDLEQMVRRGGFREDLFFRLDVLSIVVPPLRERRQDIPLLVRHFSQQGARELGREPPTFTDRALDALVAHPWPGNVRELEHTVQRLLVMIDGDRIDAPDLPASLRFTAASGGGDGHRTLAAIEADAVRRTLDRVGGNKSEAARILGIDRKTLRAKLAQHGVDAEPGDG